VILGLVVAVHVRDEFVDPKGPYIYADKLHTIGRMNGLGNYVKTRDALLPNRTDEFCGLEKEEHTVGGLAKCRLKSLGFRSGRSPNPTGVANGMVGFGLLPDLNPEPHHLYPLFLHIRPQQRQVCRTQAFRSGLQLMPIGILQIR
jgi:hypothetical protein